MHTLRQRFTAFLTVIACSFIQAAVNGQVVTPVPAPTIITSAPYTISKPGYYQLGADLYYAGNGTSTDAIIIIDASNVTLDFAGHYISGPSSASAIANGLLVGVYASEQGNLTIRNGTVAFCYYGVELKGDGTANSLNINQHIDNMLVTHCYYGGVFLLSANNSSETNCRVSFSGGNTSNGQAYGLSFSGGSANVVTGCTVTNTTAVSANAYAFYLNSDVTVKDCIVSGVTTGGTGSSNAYGLYGGSFAVGNTISNAKYGIYGCSKYANNLTNGCTTPFYAGTGVGYNN